jgi:hypothetical protein
LPRLLLRLALNVLAGSGVFGSRPTQVRKVVAVGIVRCEADVGVAELRRGDFYRLGIQ